MYMRNCAYDFSNRSRASHLETAYSIPESEARHEIPIIIKILMCMHMYACIESES